MTRHEQQRTMGSGGECVCPKCETLIPHQRGVPCQDAHCPECEARMLRVGSEHHKLWLRKKRAD